MKKKKHLFPYENVSSISSMKTVTKENRVGTKKNPTLKTGKLEKIKIHLKMGFWDFHLVH